MENEFCNYTQSLALKELGFDEPCMAIYYSKDKSFSWHHHKDHTNNEPALESSEFNISAPLYQQAFRWFREKHKLHSTITSISQESWQWHITKPGESLGKLYDEDFYTYEEAESACLDKLIEICKTKINE
jgi:hypothetical protein